MRRQLVLALIILFGSFGMGSAALCEHNSEIILNLKPSSPGIKIPSDFLGLSFETSTILRDQHGDRLLFRVSNQPLVVLFHTIGVKSLRIGGNTSDRPTVKVPDDADIDRLFEFSQLAGVKVIYTLRLRGWSPERDAPIAKYLMDHYGTDIDCIAIGNEPSVYDKPYAKYQADVARYFEAIIAPGVAPSTRFCGPATTPGSASWAGDFASSFGGRYRIRWVTQHVYPAAYGEPITNLSEERLKLISPELTYRDQQLYSSFGPAVFAAGLKYRIEETNSDYRNAGTDGVSNTFASALWGLDYLYWWAEHSAQGVNFHTGDKVAANGGERTCLYAVFSTAGTGFDIHPLAYAMKAFDLTSHGTLIPSHLRLHRDLSAYAVRGDDGKLYVTLIYKARNPGERPLRVSLRPAMGSSAVEFMQLLSPHGGLAATAGITLGGAPIQSDGTWAGKWSLVKVQAHGAVVTVAPDTAVLVRLTSRTGTRD